MIDWEIGDEEFSEEINTSYDQTQDIGDTPSDYPAAGAEPIDAKTGQDFMDIRVGEEKLNKDGTGIRRATRGVNPNKAKHKVLKFEYVSNSDCPICKEFAGKTFAIDSPNRPVIPRLEKWSKGESRPITHRNCKCKWLNVFNESVTVDDYRRAEKWYGEGFDKLSLIEKKIAIINMLKQSLGIENKPYSKMTKDELYKSECQSCGAPLSEHPVKGDNSHEWLPENPTDYEGDMSLASETKGSGRLGHRSWMLQGEAMDECSNCMMRTEKNDGGKCAICNQ